MKLIITIFRHMLAPLMMIFAVIAGVLAAGVSGLIEYHVLQQWLRIEENNLLFIPLLVVIALEGVKLFLHFSGAAFEQNRISAEDKTSLRNFLCVLPYIKWGLVIFSFVCTLIFSASSFYHTVQGEDPELVQKAKEEIEAEYVERLQSVANDIEQTYQKRIDAAFIPVQAAQDNFNSIIIVYTPWYEYVRTTEVKNNAQQTLQTAQQNYIDAQEEAERERIASMAAEKQSLDDWKAHELSKLEESELAQVAGDNQYLSKFLLFFSHTFFSQPYSRISYYICVVTISIVLSTLLEGVISISQMAITLPVGALAAISDEAPIEAAEKKKLTSVIRHVTTALISVAVFLMYGGLMEISYNHAQLGSAMICSLAVALIPYVIFSRFDGKSEEGKAKQFFQKVIAEIQAVTVKGLVSFAGFILIGMLFGETFASLSVSAIGISLGNIAGHALHLLPPSDQTAIRV